MTDQGGFAGTQRAGYHVGGYVLQHGMASSGGDASLCAVRQASQG